MHRAAELLIVGRIRVVWAGISVVGFVAVSAPVPFVLTGVRVEHDYAFIAVAVGDVQFICLRIDPHFGRPSKVLDVVASLALSGLADLQQELSVLAKLQHHTIVVGGRGVKKTRRQAVMTGSTESPPRPFPLPPIQTLPL